jgi:hypothetical protein
MLRFTSADGLSQYAPHLSPTLQDRCRRNHKRTELGISEITVKVHRGQVMETMKANFPADLVRMAAKLQSPRHAIHLD